MRLCASPVYARCVHRCASVHAERPIERKRQTHTGSRRRIVREIHWIVQLSFVRHRLRLCVIVPHTLARNPWKENVCVRARQGFVTNRRFAPFHRASTILFTTVFRCDFLDLDEWKHTDFLWFFPFRWNFDGNGIGVTGWPNEIITTLMSRSHLF